MTKAATIPASELAGLLRFLADAVEKGESHVGNIHWSCLTDESHLTNKTVSAFVNYRHNPGGSQGSVHWIYGEDDL